MHTDNVEPAKALTHPLFVAAATILFLNDHLFKGSGLLPAWLTGKASDVAGLLVAPVVLAWCLRVQKRSTFAGVHVAVGVVFSSLELSPAFTRGVVAAIDPWMATHMVADLTDLFALPALVASFFVYGRARATHGDASRPLARRAVGIAALLACCATSRPLPGRVASDGPRVVAQTAVYGAVAVVDGKTGKVERALPGNTYASPPIVADGVVYLGGDAVVGYDIATGKRVMTSPPLSSPQPVGADRKYVYATQYDSDATLLRVIDRATGGLIGTGKIDNTIPWQVQVAGNGRVVVREDDVLTIRDPLRVVHRFTFGSASIREYAVSETCVAVSTDDGMLIGFDIDTGRRLFRRADPAIERSSLLAVSKRGDLVGYVSQEGVVISRTDDGARVRTIPGGARFVLTDEGVFTYTYNGGRVESWSYAGEIRWSIPTKGSWFIDLAVTTDAVVYRVGDDELVGLDKATGKERFDLKAFDEIEAPEEAR